MRGATAVSDGGTGGPPASRARGAAPRTANANAEELAMTNSEEPENASRAPQAAAVTELTPNAPSNSTRLNRRSFMTADHPRFWN